MNTLTNYFPFCFAYSVLMINHSSVINSSYNHINKIIFFFNFYQIFFHTNYITCFKIFKPINFDLILCCCRCVSFDFWHHKQVYSGELPVKPGTEQSSPLESLRNVPLPEGSSLKSLEKLLVKVLVSESIALGPVNPLIHPEV